MGMTGAWTGATRAESARRAAEVEEEVMRRRLLAVRAGSVQPRSTDDERSAPMTPSRRIVLDVALLVVLGMATALTTPSSAPAPQTGAAASGRALIGTWK